MTISVSPLKRVFLYSGVRLPDIPGKTNEEVREVYSAQYPELLSAEIEVGGVTANGTQEISFRRAVGTKG